MSDPAATLAVVARTFGLPGSLEFLWAIQLGDLHFGGPDGPPVVRFGARGPVPVIACRLDRLRAVHYALRRRSTRQVVGAPGEKPPDGLALLGEAQRHLAETHPDLCNRIDDYLALAGRRVATAPEPVAEADDEFPF